MSVGAEHGVADHRSRVNWRRNQSHGWTLPTEVRQVRIHKPDDPVWRSKRKPSLTKPPHCDLSGLGFKRNWRYRDQFQASNTFDSRVVTVRMPRQ